MSLLEYNPVLKHLAKESKDDARILEQVVKEREETARLYAEEKYTQALDKTVAALRKMRDFSDYSHLEFRAMVMVMLFDLSELHFALKDYKQSKKELEMIFKLLERLVKDDMERFGRFHVMGMELSTRILRSRKKTLELLARQQIHTGQLYEKVNAGVSAATDKLVESLRKGAEMLASTGDYNGAVKFYMEAIKLSKKRTGRVTRREVAMTIEMARLMMRSRQQTERAKRLLNAVLPHAVALETLELEQEILQLLAQIEENVAHEPMWRSFLEKVQHATRFRRRSKKSEAEKADADDQQKEEK